MRLWVVVKKVAGKYVKVFLERMEITGRPEVEFNWIGENLGEADFRFLDDLMSGKEDIADNLRKFEFGKVTDFQKIVWRKICEIPRGEVWSYGELAEEIGRPRSFRAVANACSRNPFAFVVPCHRVVAAGGKLGGYFYDKRIKEVLLVWEGM